ncbi:MAG: hypothetical protein ACI4VW_07485 [Acutalibacteraceae bacterium]
MDLKFNLDNYIFPVAFIISICLIYFIPKKYIGIPLAAAVTACVSVYKYYYAFYAVPVLLLYCAHIFAVSQTDKSAKKNNASFVFSVLGIVSLIPQFIFADDMRTHMENHDSIGDLCYIVAYILLFIFLLVISFRTKSTYKEKIDKVAANKLRFFYTATIICICASVYTVALRATARTIANAVEFDYWFIFVIMVILNRDPYLIKLEQKFEAITLKTDNKVKK